MSEYEVPQDLDFSDEEIMEMVLREQMALGWYRWIVKSAETTVATQGKMEGCLQFALECAPLKDPKDGESDAPQRQYIRLTIPKKNPAIEGHKKPDGWTFNQCAKFLSAVTAGEDDEVPAMGHYNRELKRSEIDGEPASAEEVQERKIEVAQAMKNIFRSAWREPSYFEGVVFYAPITERTDDEGNKRRNLNVFDCEAALPDGAELVDPDNFIEAPDPDVVAALASSSGAKKKAPDKKKAASKKGGRK